MTRLGIFAVFVAAVGCAAPKETTAPVLASVPQTIDGNARLARDVVPTHYALDLTVDPAADHLSGRAEIEVDVAHPTQWIVLHGEKLTIAETSVAAGGSTIAATAAEKENGALLVELARPISAGHATLSFRYEAPITDVQEGTFRVVDAGATYVFTQFESLYARRAFPCFDEPGFKTPWSITLRVPHGLVAASNAPEIERTTSGNFDVIRFAEMPPLPSYLVAFAVGPFDVVDASATERAPGGGGGGYRLPIRILAPRGKGRLASWAAERAPKVVRELERWFGEPFPYKKVDLVALPGFDWGGMENAGLVTFRDNLVLLDPEHASPRNRSDALTTITHELSHMWFGDLVTMAWWDDVWLNEAFATLMESRIADGVEPELRCGTQALLGVGDTMRLDAKTDTRAIRQPIESGADVFNAFDDITYGKGCRVLAMCEAWVGPEAFQRAMRTYVAAHRNANATTADLYAALEAETGKPVGDILRGFVDRPGTPMIDIELSGLIVSKVGSIAAGRQSRYQPIGGRAPQPEEPWHVFVGMRDKQKTVRAILGPDEKAFGFRWFYPDAGATGYYVWKLPEKEMSALVDEHRKDLNPEERIAFVRNLSLLLESGDIKVAVYMKDLGAFAFDNDPLVLTEVVDSLTRLSQLAVDEATEPKFAEWVRVLLAPHAARIGFQPKNGEKPDVRMFRETLVRALLFLGHDPTLKASAQAAAAQFLADPKSMPADEAEGALTAAARTGDAALREMYLAAIASATDESRRRPIVLALGAFGDPALVTRSLDLILEGKLLPIDLWRLTSCMSDDPVTRRACWAWITKNYDRLRKLRGEEQSADIPTFAASFNTLADRDAVAAFFATIPSPPEGTERNLAVALETIEQNARLHDALAPGLAAHLAGR